MEGNGFVKGEACEMVGDDLPVTAESLVWRAFPEIHPGSLQELSDFPLTLDTAFTIHS